MIFFNFSGFRSKVAIDFGKLKKVATLERKCRLLCSGLGGYFEAEQVATLPRFRWLLWSGIGGYFAPEYATNIVELLTIHHGASLLDPLKLS